MIRGLFASPETRRGTSVRRVLLTCVFILVLMFQVFGAIGLRINTSPSLPIGLYITTSDPTANLVEFCPTEPSAHLAIIRGYREAGNCPDGAAPLLKPLIAHDGDFVDAPWRPRDIEQREGRILRQGNENKEVQIFRYVTEGSFDAYMWQTLETKARFIHQVMRGETSVRSAEDLETSALTYAEIKAIASGNPAVVEKIKIDTEIRKLDQLRAVHANQQRHIKWEIRDLPRQISEAKQRLSQIQTDMSTRDANDYSEFRMIVGSTTFSGKGAREESANALTRVILSWDDDQTLQPRGSFRGFEILSKGKLSGFGLVQGDERIPDLFVRGEATYSANLNVTNPVGTIQSIEHTLKSLDKLAAEQQTRVARIERELSDYQLQYNLPFEHEARLKRLLARQAELADMLDLDKGDRQAVDSTPEPQNEISTERESAAVSQDGIVETAQAYMRQSGAAIRELPITERKPPEAGILTGKAVATTDTHVAIATASNSFVILQLKDPAATVQVGEKIAVRMQQGRANIEKGFGRDM
jgi:hypothetical protein